TAVVEAFGFDFTWETLRKPMPGSDAASWLGLYRRFVERRSPTFGQYNIPVGLAETRAIDVGVFPLSSDGTTIDRLIELEDWWADRALPPRVLRPTAEAFSILSTPAE